MVSSAQHIKRPLLFFRRLRQRLTLELCCTATIRRLLCLTVAIAVLACGDVYAKPPPQTGPRWQLQGYLHDESSQYGIDDLLQNVKMMPSTLETPSFGRLKGTLWLQAEIAANPSHIDYTLEISYPHLRDIELYWVQNGKLILESRGGYESLATEDLPCRGFCFYVPDAAEAPLTLYMAVRSDSPILVPMHFYNRAELQQYTRTSHMILGVFYGTFLVMFFFNLFLYFSTQAKEYLLYDVYIASLGVWVASHDGTLRDYVLTPGSWFAGYQFHFVVTLWGVVAGGMFSQAFLNTRVHAPRCDTVFGVLILVGLSSILWILITGDTFFAPMVNLLTLFMSATAIISAIIELRRGVIMARYFLVAWVSVVAGSLMWVLTLTGLIPFMKGAAFYVHLGCFFETILLSLALGDRINQLQDERNRLQTLAKTQLEDTNRKLAISNRFKDEFLSTVSHELRTPMNGVIGSSELMKMTPLTEEQNSYLTNINRSSQNMMRLIEDILTYTQLDAGRYSVESKSINFTQLFEDLSSQFRGRAQSQGLSFSSHISPDVPRYIEGDASKLLLILNHLLENACKFTDQGSIQISATRVPAPTRPLEGSQWIRFSISDSGCGVPKHMQDTVFELFRQGDGSMTRKQGGLGIGLALCKRITLIMGGILEFHSDTQRGTDVHVFLPFKLGKAVIRPQVPSPVLALNTEQRKKVMVVEDNHVNRMVLEGILKKLGYTTVCAANGQEAVNQLKDAAVDLVFMDCQMPVMDGYEATRQIRQMGQATAQLPIVAVTANSNPGDREHCLECGMNDFIAKPYTQRDVANALDYWLRHPSQQGVI